MNLAAIILAGGLSSRMGSFKPLLPLGGMPVLRRTLEAYGGAGLRIICVTGHRAEELRPVICDAGAEEAYNAAYETGMFSSVLTGFRRASELGCDGALVSPADCPLVTRGAVARVLERVKTAPEELCVAAYRGERGHPLYVPARVFPEILTHDGEGGLRAVTRRYEQRLVETDCPGVLVDMDTPEAYRAALAAYEQQQNL